MERCKEWRILLYYAYYELIIDEKINKGIIFTCLGSC